MIKVTFSWREPAAFSQPGTDQTFDSIRLRSLGWPIRNDARNLDLFERINHRTIRSLQFACDCICDVRQNFTPICTFLLRLFQCWRIKVLVTKLRDKRPQHQSKVVAVTIMSASQKVSEASNRRALQITPHFRRRNFAFPRLPVISKKFGIGICWKTRFVN